ADRAVLFTIYAHELVWMIRRSADNSFFARRHPALVDDKRGFDFTLVEQPVERSAVRITANDATKRSLGPQTAQQISHARRAAWPHLVEIGSQYGYRSLGADASRVSPNVPIEHAIADDKHPRRANPFKHREGIAHSAHHFRQSGRGS
ncbi:MAG TPA: hypothetical protein VFW87_20700, partial [Pirellulales bacterium]|nr:hypothetical protein [Pirellulales bacterium]